MALSQRDQLLLTAGLGVLAVGGLVWALAPKKAMASTTSTAPIDTGIYVHPNCTDWTVTNAGKLTLVLEPIVDALVLSGERDPWAIAKAMEKRVAPQCVVPPTEPRSMFEAYLFYRLVLESVLELRRRNLITSVEAQNHWAQADAWALYHKVPQQNLYDYQEPS